ncbi:hypothetical protein NIES4075_64910 [Tolypothrix sp. NIES-4075]|uniref:chitin binding peritrophin-A domain-containing protein n=1 Tax=Tolypothrix sp. NIES-4075 TaxID=2005459 RepID=UPI000B5C4D58|nr:chitin binding peritrophin-A domain-containing protein [Tolypothrix sp. NIES-4075]GAX45470.1 hypothetical protein NIES4075_64910 [Tolypothrix sp. NIES-4075]
MKTIKNLACLFLVCLAVLGLWFGGMQPANAEDTKAEPPEYPAITCEYNGQYFPNPADKHSFYQCAPVDNNGALRAVLHQCAMEAGTTRLVFNPELNVCDWTDNVPSS